MGQMSDVSRNTLKNDADKLHIKINLIFQGYCPQSSAPVADEHCERISYLLTYSAIGLDTEVVFSLINGYI